MQISVFVQNRKKKEIEIFAFCVITFEPIKIQTCLAPQNDSLNLSFVKNINVVGETMARNGYLMAIYESQILVISLYVSFNIM